MTPDERARAAARIDANLADARAKLDRIKAGEPARRRQLIKTELAVERMHRANVALRAALSR
jgi:hypothetical protein